MDSSLNRSVVFFSLRSSIQRNKKRTRKRLVVGQVARWFVFFPFGAPSVSALPLPPAVSVVVSVLVREMRVEVAVHPLLRNHGVAEGTFVGAAATLRRRRHLRPHVDCVAQLGPPERLQREAAFISY